MTVESAFLRLPVELRLQIYDYCFIYGALTVSGCIVPPWWPTSINLTSGSIPGLAPDRMPIARLGFDRELLEGRPDIKNFTWVSSLSARRGEGQSTSAELSDTSSLSTHTPPASLHNPAWMLPARCSPSQESPSFLSPTIPSLHLTCRQIHRELSAFRDLHSVRGAQTCRQLDLYLSYPDGVCAVVHRYAHLLDQARAVYVCGVCDLACVKNPKQCPGEALKFSRNGASGRRAHKLSVEEEQAYALGELVDKVHLIGEKAINASQRATDRMSDADATEPSVEAIINLPSPPTSPLESDTYTSSSSPSSTHSSPATNSPRTTARILTIDPPPDPPPNPNPTTSASQSETPHPTLFLRMFYLAHRPAPRPAQAHPRPEPRLTIDPYQIVWSHNLSPICVALAAIHGGEIKLSIGRSRRGTGIEIVATGNDGRRRCVSSLGPGSRWAAAPPISEAEMWAWCIPQAWAGGVVDGRADDDVDGTMGDELLDGEGIAF